MVKDLNSQPASILVVEDHDETRDGLTMLLSSEYDCTAAASAEEAMRLLAARFFNLVVTDLQLPGASGLEVCRLSRMISPETVVIVISGMADIRYEIEALRQGSLYYIEKPIDTHRLLVLIGSGLKSQSLGFEKHPYTRPDSGERKRFSDSRPDSGERKRISGRLS